MSSSRILITMKKTMMTKKMDQFNFNDQKANNELSTLAQKKKTKRRRSSPKKIMKYLSRHNSESMRTRSTVKKMET